jgi:hypothetical protein
MLPTFNSFGDNVLISRYYRRGRGIKVGDVVSYAHPIHPDVTGLKRVLGLEGDFVLRETPHNDLEGVALGKGNGPEKMIQVGLIAARTCGSRAATGMFGLLTSAYTDTARTLLGCRRQRGVVSRFKTIWTPTNGSHPRKSYRKIRSLVESVGPG